MRVLFFGSDGVSAPVRIRPLLETLRAAGDVEDFACVDRDLAVTGGGSRFDVLLVHRNPGRRQIAWLRRSGLPFVYDIDDLLLHEPSRAARRRAREQDAIRWCLTNAAVVTSPSRRLLTTLDTRLSASLGVRAVYLPNSGFDVQPAGAAKAKPRLLWVSSAGQHYDELIPVARGIAAAAAAIGTDVVVVGRMPDAVRAAMPGHSHMPWIVPEQFQRFLAQGSYIAVAPLPTALPPHEQNFVDCKSDIKAAQFCSLGIAALYSPAVPYAESDLPCALAPTNTESDWRDGLIELARGFPESGRRLADHPAVAARSRTVVAQQLLDALSRAHAATGAAFSFQARPTPGLLRSLERKIRSLRARLFR
jgi:hypothetical protein